MKFAACQLRSSTCLDCMCVKTRKCPNIAHDNNLQLALIRSNHWVGLRISFMSACPAHIIPTRLTQVGPATQTGFAGFFIINTLRPKQNGRHFADDIFKGIVMNENVFISLKISLKFVPKGKINNIPALVQIMAWRCPGDKPLYGPLMFSLSTHICVTRP